MQSNPKILSHFNQSSEFLKVFSNFWEIILECKITKFFEPLARMGTKRWDIPVV